MFLSAGRGGNQRASPLDIESDLFRHGTIDGDVQFDGGAGKLDYGIATKMLLWNSGDMKNNKEVHSIPVHGEMDKDFNMDNRITTEQNKYVNYLIIAIVLGAVAGFSLFGHGPDYEGYRLLYEMNFDLQDYYINPLLILGREPGYTLVTMFLHNIIKMPFEVFYWGFVFLCVAVKMVGIYKLSNAKLYSVWIYFSFFYIMHEMITIRAGAAAGIFLLSIPFLVNKKRAIYLCMIFLAMLIHYSACILLPLVFLSNDNEYPQWYLVMLVSSFLGALFGFSLDGILYVIPINILSVKMDVYRSLLEESPTSLNLFSRFSLPNLLLCIILLINFNKLKNYSPNASIIIRIFAISQIMFYGFNGLPVFSTRVSELMGIVGIIAWPLLLYFLKTRRQQLIVFSMVGLLFISLALRVLLVS